MSPLILCDTLSHTATLAALWLMTRRDYSQPPTAGRAFCLGIVFAFAALIKPSLAGLIGFYIVAEILLAYFDGRFSVLWRKILWATMAVGIGFVLTMSGWWLRNYREFSAFVPFSTMSGFTLWESSGTGADGGAAEGSEVKMPPLYLAMRSALAQNRDCTVGEFSRLNGTAYRKNAAEIALPMTIGGEVLVAENTPLELAMDIYLQTASRKILRDDFERTLRITGKKFIRTWNPLPHWQHLRTWYYQIPIALSYGLTLIMATVGLFIFWRRGIFAERAAIFFLCLPVIYLAILHAIFMGSLRYRLPAEGALIVVAAGAVEHIRQRIARRKFNRN